MKKATFDNKALTSLIKCCFFAFMLMVSTQSFAQKRGKVTVVADPLFDSLLTKRAQLNRNAGGVNAGNGGYVSSYGYRVQIYSGSNRTSAYNAQAKFNQRYPEMRTYISYHEPNFKVKAGDFRTRIEAERMKAELQPFFSAMFIISEKINPPKTVVND